MTDVLGSPGEQLDADARRSLEAFFAREVGTHAVPHSKAFGEVSPMRVAAVNDPWEVQAEQVAAKAVTAPARDNENEPRLDFSRVRVHTDSKAAESASSLAARAYTLNRDIVFAQGAYAPATLEGRRLIAHELTHVLQYGRATGSDHLVVRRQAAQPSPKGTPKVAQPATPSAASTSLPTMSLTRSVNGPPCACLVVVHNDERNARKTAALMQANCAYNLVLVQPDTQGRNVTIGRKGDIDPNSLFPKDIAARCADDPQKCRDELTARAGTTKQAEREQLVQMQFFLTMNDCSEAFSLPVVALHNNDIEDTRSYLAAKAGKDITDLKVDIDKSDPAAGATQVARLKELLKTKFGEKVGGKVVKETMEMPRKTNIFRWCASSDLTKCHVGDPDHPDTITWVTNERDYEALRVKNVNVVLQVASDLPASSESAGDLSTLFLILNHLITEKAAALVADMDRRGQVTVVELEGLIVELIKMAEFGDLRLTDAMERLLAIVRLLLELLDVTLARTIGAGRAEERLRRLRFVNIETPGKQLSGLSEAERVGNYEAIVAVLKTLDLHCCGGEPAKAEGRIKTGLKDAK